MDSGENEKYHLFGNIFMFSYSSFVLSFCSFFFLYDSSSKPGAFVIPRGNLAMIFIMEGCY